jgi:hypothetical protein
MTSAHFRGEFQLVVMSKMQWGRGLYGSSEAKKRCIITLSIVPRNKTGDPASMLEDAYQSTA